MGIAKNFVVKNGLEVNSNLIVADADSGKVGIASTGPRTTLDVRGGIACTDLNVTGVATIATLEAVTGIITNGHFGNVKIAGITTLGVVSPSDVRAVNVNASGVGTFAVGVVSSLNGDNINYSGVGSIAGFLFSGGIVTSTALGAGIVTYFGDGGNLSNLPGASPGGSNLQVQFNAESGGVGVFTGHTGLTYNYQTLAATSLNVSTGATFATVNVGTGITLNDTGINVTGIATVNGFEVTGGSSVGVDVRTRNLNASGVSTFVGVATCESTLFTDTFEVAGVSTLSTLKVGTAVTIADYGIHATGIVTATGGAVVSGALTATTAIVGSAVSISADALDGGVTVRILGENLKVAGVATAQDFDSLSDINFKENVSTVDNALETVEQLRGVSFNWKESGEPSYGVIAQELETILPELVHGDDPKRVNYNGIIGVLIEAVKELSAEVKQLKARDPK